MTFPSWLQPLPCVSQPLAYSELTVSVSLITHGQVDSKNLFSCHKSWWRKNSINYLNYERLSCFSLMHAGMIPWKQWPHRQKQACFMTQLDLHGMNLLIGVTNSCISKSHHAKLNFTCRLFRRQMFKPTFPEKKCLKGYNECLSSISFLFTCFSFVDMILRRDLLYNPGYARTHILPVPAFQVLRLQMQTIRPSWALLVFMESLCEIQELTGKASHDLS